MAQNIGNVKHIVIQTGTPKMSELSEVYLFTLIYLVHFSDQQKAPFLIIDTQWKQANRYLEATTVTIVFNINR